MKVTVFVVLAIIAIVQGFSPVRISRASAMKVASINDYS